MEKKLDNISRSKLEIEPSPSLHEEAVSPDYTTIILPNQLSQLPTLVRGVSA